MQAHKWHSEHVETRGQLFRSQFSSTMMEAQSLATVAGLHMGAVLSPLHLPAGEPSLQIRIIVSRFYVGSGNQK